MHTDHPEGATHGETVSEQDDFRIIVPENGSPFLASPGAHLAPHHGGVFKKSQRAQTIGKQTIAGSIYRARDLGEDDELAIRELIAALFDR